MTTPPNHLSVAPFPALRPHCFLPLRSLRAGSVGHRPGAGAHRRRGQIVQDRGAAEGALPPRALLLQRSLLSLLHPCPSHCSYTVGPRVRGHHHEGLPPRRRRRLGTTAPTALATSPRPCPRHCRGHHHRINSFRRYPHTPTQEDPSERRAAGQGYGALRQQRVGAGRPAAAGPQASVFPRPGSASCSPQPLPLPLLPRPGLPCPTLLTTVTPPPAFT